MKTILKTYVRGWANLVTSYLYASLWMMVTILPMYPFMGLFPYQLQGKASGAWIVQSTCLVAMLVWAPFAAAVIGPLRVQKDQEPNNQEANAGG
jgi:hypothetical protein